MEEFVKKVYLRSFKALSLRRQLDPIWWHSAGTLQLDVDVLLAHWSRVLFEDLSRTRVWPLDLGGVVVVGSCDTRLNGLRDHALKLAEALLRGTDCDRTDYDRTDCDRTDCDRTDCDREVVNREVVEKLSTLPRSAAGSTGAPELPLGQSPSDDAPDLFEYSCSARSPAALVSPGSSPFGIDHNYADMYAQCVRQMQLDRFDGHARPTTASQDQKPARTNG